MGVIRRIRVPNLNTAMSKNGSRLIPQSRPDGSWLPSGAAVLLLRLVILEFLKVPDIMARCLGTLVALEMGSAPWKSPGEEHHRTGHDLGVLSRHGLGGLGGLVVVALVVT